jgi:hypothetical protein
VSGRGGEEKNSQPLPGLEPPVIQLVAQRYTTELCRYSMLVMFLVRRGWFASCFGFLISVMRVENIELLVFDVVSPSILFLVS